LEEIHTRAFRNTIIKGRVDGSGQRRPARAGDVIVAENPEALLI
jgi:hypothetical protein